MKNSNYKELFEQVKQFKKEQEKQKQRGLNNYNMFTAISKAHYENNHSKMIASFLDPFGEHYQSTLFLDKFLEILDISNFDINSKNCSVELEYSTEKKKGRIDLYITNGNKHIIIENKVYAKDQERQIERYIQKIKDKNQGLKATDILVIYLSLDKEEPTKYSLGDLSIDNGIVKSSRLPEKLKKIKWSQSSKHLTFRDFNYQWIEFCKGLPKKIALFKSIHYKNEILEWLQRCQYEVQNITNLNEVFRQYIDVVKMINNQYKDKIMSLSDYIQENKKIYKLAIKIEKELPNVREKTINDFFEKIVPLLEEKLGNEWIVEIVGNLSKKYNGNLCIYRKNWIKDKNLIFAFEFDKNNYIDGYIGIVRLNRNIDVENIVNKFSLELEKLNYKKETTEWWLHYEWLPNIKGVDDFVKYILFTKKIEKKFIKKIMNLIKIFELESNLMTEINSYLNEKDKN